MTVPAESAEGLPGTAVSLAFLGTENATRVGR
jgi:hypothetical protein